METIEESRRDYRQTSRVLWETSGLEELVIKQIETMHKSETSRDSNSLAGLILCEGTTRLPKVGKSDHHLWN